MEAVFDLDEGTYPIKVTGDADGNSAIVSKAVYSSLLLTQRLWFTLSYQKLSILIIMFQKICCGCIKEPSQ